MIEKIEHNGQIVAIIIFSSFSKPGVEFFTPDDFSQQLGYMNREAGYIIPAHTHKKIKRSVSESQEVLFIKSGKVRTDFYDDNGNYIDYRIVATGDVIMLASGGHGFKILEDAEIIEVKQGPFQGRDGKTVFKNKMVQKVLPLMFPLFEDIMQLCA